MVNQLETSVGPLKLAHPVINASGTFDVLETDRVLEADMFEDFPFAAYVPKTVTLNPRVGNEPPRLYETASGLLNSIGLANKGIEAFIADDLPRLEPLEVPLIVSVASESTEDYRKCAEMLDEMDRIDALELNISCPNVELDGRALGCDAGLTEKAVAAAREATDKILIVKLTPNVTDILEPARAALSAGADALSMINTVNGMALDPVSLRPALGHITGGLSGPAVKPVALRAVYLVRSEFDVPVIGMGGVVTAVDVLEFIAAGASAVAVGTSVFRDPLLGAGITDGLEEQMDRREIASVSELIGRAHQG